MNILIDYLPNNYKGLKIDTNFRTSILFELLMQEPNLSKEEKILKAIELYYTDQEISDLKLAVDGIIWFYKCGKEELASEKHINEGIKKQIYSYEFDAEYIFSAFLEQYKIDLNTIKYMHWWKFKALFNGLKDDTMFVKIMGYRSINISSIKDKEQQKHYLNLQKTYELPDSRTADEKESEFVENFW